MSASPWKDVKPRHVVAIDREDLDQVILENQPVDIGNVIVSDWLDVSGINEITVFVKTTKSCTTSIQVTDDNVSANPDAFDLCAKDGAGTAVSITTNNSGKSYTFTNKAEKMRVSVLNTDTASDTPYVGVK